MARRRVPSALGHFLQGAPCDGAEQCPVQERSRDGSHLSPTWSAGPRVISGQACPPGTLGKRERSAEHLRPGRAPCRRPRPTRCPLCPPRRVRQKDCRPRDGLWPSVPSQRSPRQPQATDRHGGWNPGVRVQPARKPAPSITAASWFLVDRPVAGGNRLIEPDSHSTDAEGGVTGWSDFPLCVSGS